MLVVDDRDAAGPAGVLDDGSVDPGADDRADHAAVPETVPLVAMLGDSNTYLSIPELEAGSATRGSGR